MSGRKRHTDEPQCPLCEEKLFDADPRMAAWFKQLKKRYPNVHVSWSYRNAADQNRMVDEGKSKLRYPHSKHNALQDGKRCSLALDIFQIDEDGAARFSKEFYHKVAHECWERREPIIWGGDWNGNGVKDRGDWDLDHFELRDDSKGAA